MSVRQYFAWNALLERCYEILPESDYTNLPRNQKKNPEISNQIRHLCLIYRFAPFRLEACSKGTTGAPEMTAPKPGVALTERSA